MMSASAFYTVSRVCEITGLTLPTLEWLEEEIGDLLEIRRTTAGNRLFTRTAIDQLQDVKRMLDEDELNIQQVREKLGDAGPALMHPGSPEADAAEIAAMVRAASLPAGSTAGNGAPESDVAGNGSDHGATENGTAEKFEAGDHGATGNGDTESFRAGDHATAGNGDAESFRAGDHGTAENGDTGSFQAGDHATAGNGDTESFQTDHGAAERTGGPDDSLVTQRLQRAQIMAEALASGIHPEESLLGGVDAGHGTAPEGSGFDAAGSRAGAAGPATSANGHPDSDGLDPQSDDIFVPPLPAGDTMDLLLEAAEGLVKENLKLRRAVDILADRCHRLEDRMEVVEAAGASKKRWSFFRR